MALKFHVLRFIVTKVGELAVTAVIFFLRFPKSFFRCKTTNVILKRKEKICEVAQSDEQLKPHLRLSSCILLACVNKVKQRRHWVDRQDWDRSATVAETTRRCSTNHTERSSSGLSHQGKRCPTLHRYLDDKLCSWTRLMAIWKDNVREGGRD